MIVDKKRKFIGGTNENLLTSLFESFLWEDVSNDVDCQSGEIRVTVTSFKDGKVWVDDALYTKEYLLELPKRYDTPFTWIIEGIYTKADILEFAEKIPDKPFFETIDYTKEQYKNKSTENIFSDMLSYYGLSNLGLFRVYHITLDDWYEANKESLDFELRDITEYLTTHIISVTHTPRLCVWSGGISKKISLR